MDLASSNHVNELALWLADAARAQASRARQLFVHGARHTHDSLQ